MARIKPEIMAQRVAELKQQKLEYLKQHGRGVGTEQAVPPPAHKRKITRKTAIAGGSPSKQTEGDSGAVAGD